jgi:hypothetical protein
LHVWRAPVSTASPEFDNNKTPINNDGKGNEVSKIVLYLPGNLMHGNVSARKRRQYVEEFPQWLSTLKSAGFPVATSFQGIDLEILGVTESDFDGIDLLGGMYNHALPTVFEKHKGLGNHTQWLIANGPRGNVPGIFYSEFNIPRTDIQRPGHDIIPVAPSALSFLYSLCQTGDIDPGLPISKYEAIRFREKTLVPMHLEGQKNFFEWQRTLNPEKLQAFLQELRAIRDDGKDGVKILFIDLEAPLVGSRHGLKIWEWLFAAIREAGLADVFMPFAEAAKVWEQRAVKPQESALSLVARDLGKWLGLDPQVDYLDRVKSVRPRTEAEHRLLALASTSDVCAAMDRKLRGIVTLPADEGTVTIGYDQTLIDLGYAVLNAFEHDAPLKVETADDDGRWFVDRVIERLGL